MLDALFVLPKNAEVSIIPLKLLVVFLAVNTFKIRNKNINFAGF